jgi:hypothetical protein
MCYTEAKLANSQGYSSRINPSDKHMQYYMVSTIYRDEKYLNNTQQKSHHWKGVKHEILNTRS